MGYVRLWPNDLCEPPCADSQIAKNHLEKMAASSLPLKKNLKRLLQLKDEYGHGSLLTAIKQANNHNAYGADYIENSYLTPLSPLNQWPYSTGLGTQLYFGRILGTSGSSPGGFSG